MSDLNRFFSGKKSSEAESKPKSNKTKPILIDRRKKAKSLKDLSKAQIIELLKPLMVEIPGFAANLAWTRQKILPNNPDIYAEELASELSIPVLQAYLILDQLASDLD
ncbi:hypothetical protein [Candidatus Hodarchaeum mangrovi]